MDEKDGPRVGVLRARHHFQQPRGGLELRRVMPEFPGGHLLERHVPRAADLQQGVARHRVEGLDAALEQDRQAPRIRAREIRRPSWAPSRR